MAEPDLSLFDPAMIVVTTANGTEQDGCLVGFQAQASIEPLQLCVWISTANRTCAVAREATHLGVHLLGTDQHDLAAHFGEKTGDDVDKLAGLDVTTGPGGVPLLDEVANRLVLRIAEVFDVGGDHLAFVGPIEVHHGFGPDRTSFQPLRLSDVSDLDPGHPADDPPR